MPGGFVCSGSFKGELKRVARARGGRRRAPRPQALLEGAARVLRRARPRGHRARRPDRARPGLRPQAQVRAEGLDRKLVAELWLYPDGSRILELSTKCAPAEAFQVAAETRAFLERARHRPRG